MSDKLGLEWSPEQIAAHLRSGYPERRSWHVRAETIYQALYLPARGALTRDLSRKLRTGRPMRKRRRRPNERRVRFAIPGVSIDARPAEIQIRDVPGHWEGDLIVGRHNQSAIGTLVERCSRYTRLIHLPASHDADELHDAITPVLLSLPKQLRVTLTWDQGGEMARHAEIAKLLSGGVFFADPASPWQRGTNENTNGVLRQYFHKGTDLSGHSQDYLLSVEERLNNRPRRILGWSTPGAVLARFMTP